ncbi:hypothetical protein [Hymenobacter volaticus]|uniref:STAS/SEC14 domain-containing protein n=1 Tax=Hymenobacter volaticus TaxID=2932254 RepID=A0ABY4G0D9_9BACT|nr:hypothetical protein [Hymenobacter volaticus]UOQ64296.1 hypothetical protein MUN86_11870 [Hymenobacter volaticus]
MNICPSSVCFKNEVSCITKAEEKYLHVTWLPGAESSPENRATLEHLLIELEQLRWGKVLVDQRVLMPLSEEDSAWLMLDWLPRATKHRLYRYGAVLSAKNVFSRLDLHSLTQQAQAQFPIVYRHFEEEKTALIWLLAQQ